MKLQLSKFKKMSSDGKKTVLKHPSGHQIIIAHDSLSPKMRGELAALPHYNEGTGDVKSQDQAYLAKKYPKMDNDEGTNRQAPSTNVKQDADTNAEMKENSHRLNSQSHGALGEAPKKSNAEQLKSMSDAVSGMYDGGGVAKDTPPPEPNKKNAQEMQKGAVEGDSNPDTWVKNLKEGLGMYDGGQAQDTPEQIVADAQAGAPQAAPAPAAPEMSGAQTAGYIIGQAIRNSGPMQTLRTGKEAIEGVGNFLGEAGKGLAPGLAGEAPGAPQAIAADQGGAPQGPASGGGVAPDATGQDQDPYGIQASAAMYGKGLDQQLSGISNEAKAQGVAGAQSAAAIDQGLAAKQQALDTYNHNYNALEQERQGAISDYKKNFISPDHYWDNHSKALTTVGMLVGGLGGNDPVSYLNKMMDRDLESQKANLDASHNILSANLKQFGNLHDATLMTKAMQSDMLADHLNKVAAQNQGTVAGARAQQLSGQLNQQASAYARQIAMQKTLSQMSGGAAGNDQDAHIQQQLGVLRVLNPAAAKEIEGRYVPGEGLAAVPVPQEMRDKITERKTLSDTLGALQQFQKKYGGTLQGIADPTIRAQGEALAKQSQDQYRRANQQGVFKESEAKFVNGVLADNPASLFSKFSKAPGYKSALDVNTGNLNELRGSLGIKKSGSSSIGGGSGFAPKSFKPAR